MKQIILATAIFLIAFSSAADDQKKICSDKPNPVFGFFRGLKSLVKCDDKGNLTQSENYRICFDILKMQETKISDLLSPEEKRKLEECKEALIKKDNSKIPAIKDNDLVHLLNHCPNGAWQLGGPNMYASAWNAVLVEGPNMLAHPIDTVGDLYEGVVGTAGATKQLVMDGEFRRQAIEAASIYLNRAKRDFACLSPERQTQVICSYIPTVVSSLMAALKAPAAAKLMASTGEGLAGLAKASVNFLDVFQAKLASIKNKTLRTQMAIEMVESGIESGALNSSNLANVVEMLKNSNDPAAQEIAKFYEAAKKISPEDTPKIMALGRQAMEKEAKFQADVAKAYSSLSSRNSKIASDLEIRRGRDTWVMKVGEDLKPIAVDPLLGIPNISNPETKKLMTDLANKMPEIAKGQRKKAYAFMSDVNGLKLANEAKPIKFEGVDIPGGHEAGNFILEKMGTIIRENLPPGISTRYGGDEIAGFFTAADHSEAQAWNKKVLDAIKNDKDLDRFTRAQIFVREQKQRELLKNAPPDLHDQLEILRDEIIRYRQDRPGLSIGLALIDEGASDEAKAAGKTLAEVVIAAADGAATKVKHVNKRANGVPITRDGKLTKVEAYTPPIVSEVIELKRTKPRPVPPKVPNS